MRKGYGVRVLSFSMPHVRSVSMILTYNIGSRYETDQHAGISHFIEHMSRGQDGCRYFVCIRCSLGWEDVLHLSDR